jgi:hypothetical protein
MFDIKKLAAGIIAGAAITAAPVIAFAAPASAATHTSNPAAYPASHARVLSSAQDPLRASHATPCGGGINCDASTFVVASHATPCGGGINCR